MHSASHQFKINVDVNIPSLSIIAQYSRYMWISLCFQSLHNKKYSRSMLKWISPHFQSLHSFQDTVHVEVNIPSLSIIAQCTVVKLSEYPLTLNHCTVFKIHVEVNIPSLSIIAQYSRNSYMMHTVINRLHKKCCIWLNSRIILLYCIRI